MKGSLKGTPKKLTITVTVPAEAAKKQIKAIKEGFKTQIKAAGNPDAKIKTLKAE